MPMAAQDGSGALGRAKSLRRTRFWPTRTEALRIMDDGGRALIDWIVPVAGAQSYPSFPLPTQSAQAGEVPRPVRSANEDKAPPANPASPTIRFHQLDVGQPISYAADVSSDAWRGGYEIARLAEPESHEPQYATRNADQAHSQTVPVHKLHDDLGARGRGL
jgi:hypothetical protein